MGTFIEIPAIGVQDNDHRLHGFVVAKVFNAGMTSESLWAGYLNAV